MRLLLFEDEYTRRLNPLVHLRPVYDLIFGIRTIREKYQNIFEEEFETLHCREELAAVMMAQNPKAEINSYSADKYVLINGRSIITESVLQSIDDSEDALYLKDGVIAAAVLSGSNIDQLRAVKGKLLSRKDFPDLHEKEIECTWINYPWNLFLENGKEIIREFEGPGIHGKVHNGVNMLNDENIFIAEGAVIKPGVMLDAEEGPIIIDVDAHIMANAYLQGPLYIGKNSIIKAGAKIYEGTTIGDFCKVGGEVEEAIFHSYSNKQHDGFLGHSYLAMWVNLGAGTNNSDLKNNYGNVKFYVEGESLDTGTMFCGLVMGDHSKSGINTMFNTGTHVGISSNLYGSGFPPKFVPSFSWGGAEEMTTHQIDKAVATARLVMARRDVEMSSEEEALLKDVFEKTAPDRATYD